MACQPNLIENKIGAAYRRGNLFDKRRKLMAGGAACLRHQAGKVVAFKR